MQKIATDVFNSASQNPFDQSKACNFRFIFSGDKSQYKSVDRPIDADTS